MLSDTPYKEHARPVLARFRRPSLVLAGSGSLVGMAVEQAFGRSFAVEPSEHLPSRVESLPGGAAAGCAPEQAFSLQPAWSQVRLGMLGAFALRGSGLSASDWSLAVRAPGRALMVLMATWTVLSVR